MNKRKITDRSIKRVILLMVLGLFICSQRVFAAVPNLRVAASQPTVYLGDTFYINARINSEGIATNAYKADISFDKGKISVISVETGGSVCLMWPMMPSHNNDNGTVTFSCGLPDPGYSSNGGLLTRINFRANAYGVAQITLQSTSEVYANDGAGTNIIDNVNGTQVEIIARPAVPTEPEAPSVDGPVVNSTTHIDQQTWYSNDDPILNWQGQVNATGYSYSLDQIPGNFVDNYVDSTALSYNDQDLDDGIYYFHIKALSDSGWGPITHYKLLVDTIPPKDFIPYVTPDGVIKTPTPEVHFNTTDELSGIDRYELRIDDGDFVEVTSPYKLPTLSSGTHLVILRAFDKAGNVTIGKTEIEIMSVSPPKILNENNAKIRYGEELVIYGNAEPGTEVSIYRDSFDNLIGVITADATGYWELRPRPFSLFPGKQKVFAIVTDKETGIQSSMSNIFKFEVVLSAIRLGWFLIPWWVIALILFTLLWLLFLWLLWLIALFKRRKEERDDELYKLKNFIHRELDYMEETLEDDLDETMTDKNASKKAEVGKEFEEMSDVLLAKEEKKIFKEIDKIIEKDKKKKNPRDDW